MQRHVAQSAVVRYGVAVVCVTATVILALWLRPMVLAAAQLLLVAVLITGWVSGLGPALVAWVLATLAFDYYFTPPLRFTEDRRRRAPASGGLHAGRGVLGHDERCATQGGGSLNRPRRLEARVRERTGPPGPTSVCTWRRRSVAAQHRFRDLVNSVEAIVWEADATTFQFSFVSNQAERILGYPVERWLSEPTFWKDHLHPDDREWAVAFCEQATGEKRDHDFEYRMIAADGRVVWLRRPGDRGGGRRPPARLRGVMVDITAPQARPRRALRGAGRPARSHARHRLRADMTDVITYWNRAAEEFYGWTGRGSGRQGLAPADADRSSRADREHQCGIAAGRAAGKVSSLHTKADGSQVVVASRWSLQRRRAGSALAILETNNDITERKQARGEAARERAAIPPHLRVDRGVDLGGGLLTRSKRRSTS